MCKEDSGRRGLERREEERQEALLAHLERLLPDPGRSQAFRAAMVAEPSTCVRLNSLLPVAEGLRGLLAEEAEPVPWSPDAFTLRRDSSAAVGHSLEYRLGALYVQAKATTLASVVLDPRPGQLVLDLAAAPGGKATQIAAALGNTGILVANEPGARRRPALVGHLERCGAHNTLITGAPGSMMARWFHNVFDRVLLDAPCSGDGILCKDRHMLAWWSPEDARRKSVQQVGLLRAAFHMLRPGGRLVYSTCSLSTEENEDVLLGLVKRYGDLAAIETVAGVKASGLAPEAAARYPAAFGGCVRVWPHEHATEGAFVAAVGKRGATGWDPVEGDAGRLLAGPPPEPDPAGMAERIRQRWGFSPEIAPGQELIAGRRHLQLRPAGAARLQGEFPWFVRTGMRVAGLHKGALHLSQQAVALWGHQVRDRRLDLSWSQVAALFRGEEVDLPSSPAGEVICFHDGHPVCRALPTGEGRLRGYLPKVSRTDRLQGLFR